jgi:hypothetical protein
MTAIPPIKQLFLRTHGAGRMGGGRSPRGPFVAQVLPLPQLPALVANLSEIGAGLERVLSQLCVRPGSSFALQSRANLTRCAQAAGPKLARDDYPHGRVVRTSRSFRWGTERQINRIVGNYCPAFRNTLTTCLVCSRYFGNPLLEAPTSTLG